MENLTSIVVALVGFTGSVISGLYLSRVEPIKSKLKKTEMLFDLKIKAAREFNEICQKYNPLNLNEIHDDKFYGEKKWNQIRDDVLRYRSQNEYVFENNEISQTLDDVLKSLDYSSTPRYLSIEANSPHKTSNEIESMCYMHTINLMGSANEKIRKYLFEETKK
jgi:hypothetical protein